VCEVVAAKILVLSDSHGYFSRIDDIIAKESPCDYIVHCGDGIADMANVSMPRAVPVIRVAGNVDLYRDHSAERIEFIEIEDNRIMIVHGDLFNVQNGFSSLRDEASRRGAGIVLFGHTHVPFYERGQTVLFNPGTVSRGSYGIVMLSQKRSSNMFIHKNLNYK